MMNYDKRGTKQCITQTCFFKLINMYVLLCATLLACFPPCTSRFWGALCYRGTLILFSLGGHFGHFQFGTVKPSAPENILGFFLVSKNLRTLREGNLGTVDILDLMFLVGDYCLLLPTRCPYLPIHTGGTKCALGWEGSSWFSMSPWGYRGVDSG